MIIGEPEKKNNKRNGVLWLLSLNNLVEYRVGVEVKLYTEKLREILSNVLRQTRNNITKFDNKFKVETQLKDLSKEFDELFFQKPFDSGISTRSLTDGKLFEKKGPLSWNSWYRPNTI